MSREDKMPLYLSTPHSAPIDYKEYMNCQAILGQMSREDQMLLYLSTPHSAPANYKRVYELSSNIRSNVWGRPNATFSENTLQSTCKL